MKVIKTAEARIHAETMPLPLANYSAGTTTPFSLSLTNFASPPIASVTPVIINSGASAICIMPVITGVTAASIRGYIYFITAVTSSQTVGISAIAIGVPSNSQTTAGTNIQDSKFYSGLQTTL